MSTDATPKKIRPIRAGEVSPPPPDAEANARAIAEAQGTLGKATYENFVGAGKDLWDSDEDFERFMALLNERRKQG